MRTPRLTKGQSSRSSSGPSWSPADDTTSSQILAFRLMASTRIGTSSSLISLSATWAATIAMHTICSVSLLLKRFPRQHLDRGLGGQAGRHHHLERRLVRDADVMFLDDFKILRELA